MAMGSVGIPQRGLVREVLFQEKIFEWKLVGPYSEFSQPAPWPVPQNPSKIERVGIVSILQMSPLRLGHSPGLAWGCSASPRPKPSSEPNTLDEQAENTIASVHWQLPKFALRENLGVRDFPRGGIPFQGRSLSYHHPEVATWVFPQGFEELALLT